MSTLNVDKVDPSTGTALELGTSGDTISIPSGATLDISSATLTPPATMPASSGVNLTALNATQLTSGTVPAARLSGLGKILQIVQGSTTTLTSTTTQVTFADTTLTADIVPQTDSDVLILVTQHGATSSSSLVDIDIRLVRDSTVIQNWGKNIMEGANPMNMTLPTNWLDTAPGGDGATTITYKTQFRLGDDAGTSTVQAQSQPSTIILLEIAA